MDIGIYAPYGPHEVTVAALRVADHVLCEGMRPRLLACGPIVKGVHPYWDQHVKPGGTKEIYAWAQDCDHLVWFDYRPDFVRRARLVAPKAPQVLVFRWHHTPKALKAITGFDRVICPSKEAKKSVLANLAVHEDLVKWCLWESGLPPLPRRARRRSRAQSLYIPVDNYTVEKAGGDLLTVVARLLVEYPHLSITVEPARKWPPLSRYDWAAIARIYADRLRVVDPVPLPDQSARFYDHTWTFCPALRAEFGMTVLRSLSCGTPVVVHDIHPFSGMIHDRREGLLIACDITIDRLGAPVAKFDVDRVFAVLATAIENTDLADALRTDDWHLERRGRVFADAWKMV